MSNNHERKHNNVFSEKSVKDNYKWWALATVAIGTFMGPIDISVANIALPTLSVYFGVPVNTVEWVVTAYLLVISSFLLSYGRLGDMYGHKNIYIGGFTVFTLGSLFSALSTTITMLIMARVVQAIGAGMMMAIGPAVIAKVFPPQERGKAMGINGMTVASGLAIGPPLGGILIHSFGWQSIFFINIPIGVFGTIWAWRVLKKEEAFHRQVFDVKGTVFLSLFIFSMLLLLSKGETWGWGSALSLVMLAAMAISAVLFVFTELKAPDPMMDLHLFSNRLFTMASISALLNFIAQSAMIFLMPFYLINILELNTSYAGMILMASPVVLFFVSPLSGMISDQIGSRLLCSVGMIILSMALFLLSTLGPATPVQSIIIFLALVGAGTAMFQSPNSSALMGSVPKNRLGVGSGMLATMRNMGMVIGMAVAAAIYSARLPVYTDKLLQLGYQGQELKVTAFKGAMHDAFFVAGILAVFGIFTSLARPKGKTASALSDAK